jgi:predicted membrane channel-forming protein YqfA (hemolysin III family)
VGLLYLIGALLSVALLVYFFAKLSNNEAAYEISYLLMMIGVIFVLMVLTRYSFKTIPNHMEYIQLETLNRVRESV